MGAERFNYYYSPRPCETCGAMLPAGIAHLHEPSRFRRLLDWLRAALGEEEK